MKQAQATVRTSCVLLAAGLQPPHSHRADKDLSGGSKGRKVLGSSQVHSQVSSLYCTCTPLGMCRRKHYTEHIWCMRSLLPYSHAHVMYMVTQICGYMLGLQDSHYVHIGICSHEHVDTQVCTMTWLCCAVAFVKQRFGCQKLPCYESCRG